MTTLNMELHRQGDILIRRVSALPSKKSTKRENGVLAEGEVTSHCHKLDDLTAAEVLEIENGLYLRVGEEGGLHPVGVLTQVGEVGKHEVDAGHLGLGEHDPAVDDEDAVVDLEAEAVAADLAEPAEEGDLDGLSHGGS